MLYTNNNGQPNTVSVFSVGPDGALSSIAGSPFPTGSASASSGNDIEVSSNGNLLAVSNDRGPSVSVFSINPDTGKLAPVPGSPFSTGTGILGGLSIEFTTDNHFLIAANRSTGKIAVFSVASDGALTPVAGSPFSASNNSIGPVKVSLSGQFLFAALNFSPRIAVFSIDSNGALTPVPGSPFPVATESDIVSIDINCAGSLLFAADNGGQAFVFSVGSGGALTPVSGSPFRISNFNGTQDILLNTSGNILFTSNQSAATVSAFSVSSNGSLSSSPVSTVFVGDINNEDRRPIDLSINQAGTLLYAMNADSTIHVFNVAASGLLAVVPGSPFVNTGGSGFGATLAAFPPRACATGPSFDMCVQDEGNGTVLKINSTTGEYQFTNCNNITLSGTGTLRLQGCKLELNDSRSDRKLRVEVNSCAGKGTALLKVLTSGEMFTINDKNTTDNTCACN